MARIKNENHLVSADAKADVEGGSPYGKSRLLRLIAASLP